MTEEVKRTIEALLFAAGRALSLEEIAKICKLSEEDALKALNEFKLELDEKRSPTMLVQDDTSWKLTVREKYVRVAKKVVTKKEMPKSILETLAVIAYKAPVLQSKVIKVRTNKAYGHVAVLEKSGFITRQKSGRTQLIRLAPKFFEYFDIDPSKLKQKFGNSAEVEKAIEVKEREIEQIEAAQRAKTEEQLATPDIVLVSDKGTPKKLKVYPTTVPVELEPTGVEVVKEKMGELDVYDLEVSSKNHLSETSEVAKAIAELQKAEHEIEALKEEMGEDLEPSEEHVAEQEEHSEEQPEPAEDLEEAEPEENETESEDETPEDEPVEEESEDEPQEAPPEEGGFALAEVVEKLETEETPQQQEPLQQESTPEPAQPAEVVEEKQVVEEHTEQPIQESEELHEPKPLPGQKEEPKHSEQPEPEKDTSFAEDIIEKSKERKIKEKDKGLFSKSTPEMDTEIEKKIHTMLTGEESEEEKEE